MKRLILFLVLSCFLFSACVTESHSLPIHYALNEIQKVELSDHTSGERVVLATLTDEEIIPFTEKLSTITCFQYRNDPPTENGYLSIFLYYKNGDIEILGTDICDIISDKLDQDGWYYIDANTMWNLFANYVDVEMLPPQK